MRRIISVAIAFVLLLTQSLFAQGMTTERKFLHTLGIEQFTFGMTEQQVVRILQTKKYSHALIEESRLKSVIACRPWWKTDKLFLEGTVNAYFHFEGTDVLKKNRVLNTIRLLWSDWYDADDINEGSKIIEDNMVVMLGAFPEREFDFSDPLWRLDSGTMRLISISERLELEYRHETPVQDIETTSDNTQSKSGIHDASYSVQWLNGNNRLRLKGELPQVPEGSSDQVVKIMIVVSPNGSIKAIQPVEKLPTPLVDGILRLVRGWQFAPLRSHEPTLEQNAVITFLFKAN